MIAAAEQVIAQVCNRDDIAGNYWLSAARTEYLDGEFSPNVMLRFYPITAIASVSVTSTSSTLQAITLTELECDGIPIASLSASLSGIKGRLGYRSSIFGSATAYDAGFTPQLTQQWGSNQWPNFGGGRKRVVVVYTGGFTTAPPVLVMCATMLVAKLYRESTRDPSLVAQTLGQFRQQWSENGGKGDTTLGSLASLFAPYVRTIT